MKIKRVLVGTFFIIFLLSCASSVQDKEENAKEPDSAEMVTNTNERNTNNNYEGESNTVRYLKKERKELKEKINKLEKRNEALKKELKKTNILLSEKTSDIKNWKKELGEVNWMIAPYIGGLLAFLFLTFLLILIAFIKLSRRKRSVLELTCTMEKLDAKIKGIEFEHSSKVNRNSPGMPGFGGKVEADSSAQFERLKEVEKPIPPPDLISPLYNDKRRREERKMSVEDDIFLDIAQVIYTQMQRGERITSVLLDRQGTWRNSMFILTGQSLYINFHSYNEAHPFVLDFVETEQLINLIYELEGEGNIIKCEPATVNMVRNGYCVVKKGRLLLR